jgi:hypothetical protein
MSYFTTKKQIAEIKPVILLRNADKHYNLGYDINFAFVADPPRQAVLSLVSALHGLTKVTPETTDEEKEALYKDYNAALCFLIVDCDIEGTSWDTPEEVSASASIIDNQLSDGLFFRIVMHRANEIMDIYNVIKKNGQDSNVT